MSKNLIKLFKKIRQKLLRCFIYIISSQENIRASDTTIIAPHPDDESLACGGLILHKKLLNSIVYVVFITNGESSHSKCCNTSTAEIGHVRRQLAIDSGKMLGLKPSDMFWLDLPDGRIPMNNDANFNLAVQKFVDLFITIKPSEIYIPHHLDCWPDHEAANEIVRAALSHYETKYELD